MRLPRVRLTVRLMILAVAVPGAACAVFVLVDNAAQTGRRDDCRAVLGNQIAGAVCGYVAVNGSFPPGAVGDAALPPERRLSWVTLIYWGTDDYQGVEFLFVKDKPWDSPENISPRVRATPVTAPAYVVSSWRPPWFRWRCPANPNVAKPGTPDLIDYVGIAGLGSDASSLPVGHPRAGVFGYDRRTRPGDITDGASTTMMLAETTLANGPWTAGGPATVRGLDPGRTPYIGRGHQFGGAHRGGAMVALADGSVRFLRETIDPKVFEALSTIAGGESLPPGWDR